MSGLQSGRAVSMHFSCACVAGVDKLRPAGHIWLEAILHNLRRNTRPEKNSEDLQKKKY